MFSWRLWVLESVCCPWDRVWGSHLFHPIVCFCCCCLSKSEGLDIEPATLKPSRGSVCRSLYLPDFLGVLIHLCLSVSSSLPLDFLCVLIHFVCLFLPSFSPLSLLYCLNSATSAEREVFIQQQMLYSSLKAHIQKDFTLQLCMYMYA